MTLYLKYRPQSFADVVGQDHVVTTMEQAISKQRISHAYLLCGTRGTGKTSVARILAKTILLQGITDETIRSHMTKGIEDGSLVDLIEIDAASNRRIDDVRDLIEKINFAPAVSKAKVYIIDEVHMLTKEAFNALLKTLEEPPDYAYFILATTELHKVPDTIQSRCQRFLFKRVKDEDIVRRLQYIVDQEKIVVDREALRAIARHASGSFRDGISLLDQLRSLSKITLADVSERIGKTAAVYLEDIFKALEEKNVTRMTELVGQIEEANIPLDSVVADLLGFVRSGLHTSIEKKESPAGFVRMMDILLQALKDIRLSPLPGLVLESALIRLCGEEELITPVVEASERVMIARTPPAPITHQEKEVVTPKQPEQVTTSSKPTIVEAEALTVQSVLQHWDQLLKTVTPPSVRMSLKDATVTGIENGTINLSFASAFHKDKIADTKASRTVEDALQKIFLKPVRIRCGVEKAATKIMSEPATDLAEAAAEVFGNF